MEQPEQQQENPSPIIIDNTDIEYKSLKKNKSISEKLLKELQDRNVYEEQQLKAQQFSKSIKRRMLETNLTDRRALGGLLGTAILGVIGLAVGLNVIGIIIGGIVGAFLGRYAGKRVKENALKKKKLMNINLSVIKFAAYVQHIIELDLTVASVEDIRILMSLLLNDCKMVVLFREKLLKPEKKQVMKIEKKLLKYVKKNKCLYAMKEIYWMIKVWIANKETFDQMSVEENEHIEKEMAHYAFNFLRPLSKLMAANRKMLNNNQKKFEIKINSLLLSPPVLNIKEKFIQQIQQQNAAEEEFLDSIYKEVELKQLKAMLEDQIAQELLKEDEIKEQQRLQQLQPQDINLNIDDQSIPKNHQEIIIFQNQSNCSPQNSQLIKERNQDNTKFIVWSNNKNSSGINNPSYSNPAQYQSYNNNNKSRLIDIIHMASQQKEEEFASYASQKNEQFQSTFAKQAQNNNHNSSAVPSQQQHLEKSKQKSPHQEYHVTEQDNCIETKNDDYSSDSLKDANKNNNNHQKNGYINNNIGAKSLNAFDIQTIPNQDQINNKKDTGQIPQKYLSNNGEEENAIKTFFSQSQSQFAVEDIKIKGLTQEKNMKSYQKNSSNTNKYLRPHTNEDIKEIQNHESNKNEHNNVYDPSNYQTYVEEGNKSTKKVAQKVYSKQYQESRNLNQKMGQSNNHHAENLAKEEDLQAAIEELKFDSIMLNQNQCKRIKQIIQLNNHAHLDNSPTQSFVRNKRGDLFLKMNSSDSIMTNEVQQNPSKKQINNNIQDNLQNQDDQENDQEKGQTRLSSNNEIKLNINEIQIEINDENNFNSINNNKNFIQQNSNKINSENQEMFSKPIVKSQYHTQIEISNEQYHQQNHMQTQQSIKKVESHNPSLSQVKDVEEVNQKNNHNHIVLDIENSPYYFKDDQEQLDNVVVSVLNSSQIKKAQTTVQSDAEIEQKLLKLKELDEENPDKVWDKVISKDKISIYKKQIPNNPSVMVRAEALIAQCTQEEVFEQIYYEKYRTKWDKVTLGFSVIETLGEMQDVIYFYIDPGFGVTKRDFLQKRAVRRDYPQKGEITIVFFSTTHPSQPEKKGTIRAISHIAAYIIRPIKNDPKSCHLTIITQSDVKGQIPKYIVNFLSARAPAKWIESMKKGVVDHRKTLLK